MCAHTKIEERAWAQNCDYFEKTKGHEETIRHMLNGSRDSSNMTNP